jgi:hypothetical protein
VKPFVVPKAKPVRVGPSPAKLRQADTKAALLEAGGARKSFNLDARALFDIERVKACYGLKTDTEAVIKALRIARKS